MMELTVGKLKKALEDYPNDAVIYMEPSNKHQEGKKNTGFSQKAEYVYPCKKHGTEDIALMIVGSVR